MTSRPCPRCGWINTWTDSGDRGLAQRYHDERDCCAPCAGDALSHHRAQAWREGWEQGIDDAADGSHRTPNPYRPDGGDS